jgi:hypothetical protein
MTDPQYSINGFSYSNFTRAMLAGSYYGMFELVYPPPTAIDLAGQPCGAYGLPTAILRSKMIPSTGMTTWLGFFSSATLLSIPFWMDVWNPYTQGLTRVSGTLLRPRWVRVRAAKKGAFVQYETVEITLIDAIAAA